MFDEQPDGDSHGECAAEIHRLQAENEKFRAAFADLLSVRDQFAVAAMKAMLAAGHDKHMRGYEGWREEFCAEAYRWADAMQAVRVAAGVSEPGHQTFSQQTPMGEKPAP